MAMAVIMRGSVMADPSGLLGQGLIHYTGGGTLDNQTPMGTAMDFDEPRRPAKPQITLGEDLSLMSVEELRSRIQALEAEIARIESELEAKTSSRGVAESVFKR